MEVQIHTDSDDDNTLQCINGKIIRIHDTDRAFDVAVDVQTTNPSDAVIKGVPNQALRKRFLHGEIVECYQERTGWLLAYVLGQLPNAVSVPERRSVSEHIPLQCTISLYVVFVSGSEDDSLPPQTLRVRSYHIRKLLGHPSEQIFPSIEAYMFAKAVMNNSSNSQSASTDDDQLSVSASSDGPASEQMKVRATPLSREDQEKEIAKFLDDFRANLVEGDVIEVAIVEGVASRRNSFRRAICARVPG